MIDVDAYEDDRDKIHQHIVEKFGLEKTGYVFALGTVAEKATIDLIGKALKYPLDEVKKIKSEFENNPSVTKEKYKELFYYFDGVLHTKVSQSLHPAGIVASPITLDDNYGCMYNSNGKKVMQLDMDAVHDVGLAKFDILGLTLVLVKVGYMLEKP